MKFIAQWCCEGLRLFSGTLFAALFLLFTGSVTGAISTAEAGLTAAAPACGYVDYYGEDVCWIELTWTNIYAGTSNRPAAPTVSISTGFLIYDSNRGCASLNFSTASPRTCKMYFEIGYAGGQIGGTVTAKWTYIYNSTNHTVSVLVPVNLVEGEAASCTLPWGGTLASGGSIAAFQNATVPNGSSCVSETRTCNNGSLSGSFTHQSCSVSPLASCNLPWGGSLPHGSSVIAYLTGSVPAGGSCSSETRLCTNGNLSGSYASQSCSEQEACGW